jgi:hydroxymethylglutaryl-CoA lyase
VKERVRITDVSPRDGLQNEAGIIPTADKVRLIELLCATGVDEIEVTSFVSPKWVPQLGDAAEVIVQVLKAQFVSKAPSKPSLNVLIPNEKGLELLRHTELGARTAIQDAIRRTVDDEQVSDFYDALAMFGIDKISVFTAASETFSKKNTNASIDETIERFRTLLRTPYRPDATRGYVSCVIACPFEGPIEPRRVAAVVEKLVRLGVTEIDLGDTIGAADIESTTHLLLVLRDQLNDEWFEQGRLTLHLHDTFGRAAECVKVALDMGVRSFDGSVAGLGGCPYASKKLPDGTIQRAPGNISTELLVQTIEDAGYETGVDRDALAKAAAFAREIVAKSRAGA